jgi:hypothetical protein
MSFELLPNNGRICFKTSGGTVLTTAFSRWGPLISTDTRFTTPEGEVKNTVLFVCEGFTQRRLTTRLVDQGHYIWVNATEHYRITGLEDFGNQTTFVGLKEGVSQGFTPSSATGLISEWAFETASTLVTDAQARNNLTDINTVGWSSDKPSVIPFNIGSAVFASASSEQLRITDASQSGLDITGNLTIAFRFKLTSGGAVRAFVCKAAADPNLGYYVFYDNVAGVIEFEISSDGSVAGRDTATGATVISLNVWYSVVAVYDGVDMRIYLNGILDYNGAQNPSAHSGGIFNNGQNFCLGARSDSAQFLNGSLAHVFIFNQAKSAEQVLAWHQTDVWI